MIWLNSDYLMFQMPSGESVAFSSEAIAVEIVDEADGEIDSEMVKQAANAVYHYFKHELGRQMVTVGEFAQAMEKALDGFEISILSTGKAKPDRGSVVESDLCDIAHDSGDALELCFFPRLRDALRAHMVGAPNVVRLRGLRGCVKHLTGAKRWSLRCRRLEDQIVSYVRECVSMDAESPHCTLVMD